MKRINMYSSSNCTFMIFFFFKKRHKHLYYEEHFQNRILVDLSQNSKTQIYKVGVGAILTLYRYDGPAV